MSPSPEDDTAIKFNLPQSSASVEVASEGFTTLWSALEAETDTPTPIVDEIPKGPASSLLPPPQPPTEPVLPPPQTSAIAEPVLGAPSAPSAPAQQSSSSSSRSTPPAAEVTPPVVAAPAHPGAGLDGLTLTNRLNLGNLLQNTAILQARATRAV
ncbi:hypothetical protein BN1723_014411 [Verticillium longisporum]|uniref:Uncharacterized protein n=1 Tax=Verticillium longisporum TaxID=100787 RepID=A0A0G4M8U7_VERLO|nr:hypothetical protein BN1723_014411 [Verticillium longisporum]